MIDNYTSEWFYQNEKKVVQIALYDDDNADFEPDSAYSTVKNSSGTVVIEEQSALSSGNLISTIIGPTVTGTVGEYYIVWRILKNDNIYYRKTNINVYEL